DAAATPSPTTTARTRPRRFRARRPLPTRAGSSSYGVIFASCPNKINRGYNALVTMIARALAVLVALSALSAQAAPIDDAKKAFAEGKAAYERGDYETALAAYQRANTILPAPNLYYNIGATYERLGKFQEAALAFDKFFEMAGAPATDEDKDFQEKLHERAEADRKKPNAPTQHEVPP